MAVQRLGLHPSTAWGTGSIPGRGTKVLRAARHSQKQYQCDDTDRYRTHVCVCSVAQPRLTLCDPRDCSLPGSSVHGILQARMLEWVAISFSRGPSPPRHQTHVFYIGRNILDMCLRFRILNGIRKCLTKNTKSTL